MPDFSQGYELILATWILLTPLLSFVFTTLFKEQKHKTIGFITTFLAGITFLIAFILSVNLIHGDNVYQQIQWISLGSNLVFNIGMLLDELTGVMLVVVTFISFLVHIFSMGYMSGDLGYGRYFGLLGLFTFSMLGIILSDNLLLLFIFWELVGFTSYLLIGFWYEKPSAVKASKKAFIVNRIGDLGFIVAIMILWSESGSLHFLSLQQINIGDPFWMNLAGIGLLCGVMGKSAQFPLQVWLPDAMEGPTPVSALIHAATMVAAGIFLLARVFVMLSPQVLDIVAFIGAITAFMGAIAAIKQYDIKKVLAFSTISQLGYMVMGIGVGATGGAIFHLATHAFFKACLFLSAGAVTYWIHQGLQDADKKVDAQDMRSMGGLRKYLPLVFVTFSISAMSLVGLPFFSGFLSKDAILTGVLQWTLDHNNLLSILIVILAFGSVLLTGYYMTRQVIMVFFGNFRLEAFLNIKTNNALPFSMKFPLVLLALGSVWLLFSLHPLSGENSWLMILFGSDFEKAIAHNVHWTTSIIAFSLSLGGIGFSYFKFRKFKETESSSGLAKYVTQLSTNNWFLDHIYQITFVNSTMKIATLSRFVEIQFIDRIVNYIGILHVVLSRIIGLGDRYIVDGMVHLTTASIQKVGKIAKNMQGDQVQQYIITALISIILMVGILIFMK